MRSKILCVAAVLLSFVMVTCSYAGKGYMGGTGDTVVEDVTSAAHEEGGSVETVDSLLPDKKSDAGHLFGDLYRVLRYQGSEVKYIPELDEEDNPLCTDTDGNVVSCDTFGAVQGLVATPEAAVGGEPILSEGYGYYVMEIANPLDPEAVTYTLAYASFPSQCVQPVANFLKWGDIGRQGNTLPLIMTYDTTWGRTECAVGDVQNVSVDPSTGALTVTLNEYFIQPGEQYGGLEYCEGIKWTDMVEEVDFGRLSLSRSPEAILQAAFDEAISSINNAVSLSLDPAGRFLLENEVNSEIEMVEEEGCAVPVKTTVFKAIDSPLENLALYTKLMQDGHLITPGVERAPIDRSENGGVPLWKMLELSDGPSTDLRPTIDIEKMTANGFSELVTSSNAKEYFTYYACTTDVGLPVDCLCAVEQPDGTMKTAMCPEVAARTLQAVEICPAVEECGGPWLGLTDESDNEFSQTTLAFASAFLAAAADKTGTINADMVVYINSILGINKVIGYSEYDSDGNPAVSAVDYSVTPEYFDYSAVTGYDRLQTMNSRGDAGFVTVLEENTSGVWLEGPVSIMDKITFQDIGQGAEYIPDGETATSDILGFTQMADDNLSLVRFVHTYQIPGLR